MKKSAVEETSSFRLDWSVATVSPAGGGEGALVLEYAMHAREELYITDRLWTPDEARRRAPDPFGAYRFVHDESLRLVLAQAPAAPNLVPRIVYPPRASRVGAGETRSVRIELTLPVVEYSALASDTTLPTEASLVSSVVFVVGMQLRADMDVDPIPPTRQTAEEAGYVVYGASPIISSCEVAAIPVRRRTGYMPRYALPGEAPPGPAPRPGT